MSRISDASLMEAERLIRDLRRTLDLPPAERVRELKEWGDNSGLPTSIRTRLHALRALAAAEVAESVPSKALPAALGTGRTVATELTAHGRALALALVAESNQV